MKKILVLLSILAAMVFVLVVKPSNHNHQIIGIVQIVEHPALDVTRIGFINKLKELGFENGKNVQILYESAQGNPALAAQISQKFVGQKVDVIVALGTTPAQAALQNIMQFKDQKKIPLVFLSVSDPLSAKLVDIKDNDMPPSSEFSCGISNYVEPQEQLKMFKKVLPKMLNLGLIYNPGEANSAHSLDLFNKCKDSFHVNVIAVPATKTSDVIMAAQSLLGKVDAIFIDNDNTALAAFSSLSDFCSKNKIPLFVSDVDIADQALASLGADQKRVGEQGAEFAALLLKKESSPEKLGFQYPDKVDLVFNKKFGICIGVEFSKDLLKDAKKIIN